MLNKAMEAALNKQINEEMASAYIYLSMAAYTQAQNHPGVAHWLQVQAQEEMSHAMKFYGFVNERGGRVTLQAIAQPQAEWADMVDVFANVLKHEQKVTALIHDLYALAMAEKDFASIPLLQWFVNEQVEEEKNAEDMLHLMKVANGNAHTMLMVDREMGHRAAE